MAAWRMFSSMLPEAAPIPTAPAMPRAKKHRRSVLSVIVDPFFFFTEISHLQ
jgi:hypothetical protein